MWLHWWLKRMRRMDLWLENEAHERAIRPRLFSPLYIFLMVPTYHLYMRRYWAEPLRVIASFLMSSVLMGVIYMFCYRLALSPFSAVLLTVVVN
jgi:hypothetical protein